MENAVLEWGRRLLSLSVAVSLYVCLWLSLSLALSAPGVPEKTQNTLHNVAAFWRFFGKRYCGGSVGESSVARFRDPPPCIHM